MDIEPFGNSKEERFKTFLELPSGIPARDTFGDVFARLDAQEFWERFLAWVKAVSVLTRGQVIANITIYGETLRRFHGQSLGKTAIAMVSAWASENRLVSGEKTNEITTIPELLALLDVSGCIVTIDAMGCRKEITRPNRGQCRPCATPEREPGATLPGSERAI